MSRVGKNPIIIPKDVSVKVNGLIVSVSGPKGSSELTIHKDMEIKINDNQINVNRPTDIPEHRALHGTTRQLLNNLIIGVSEGFVKELEVIGVGYQATIDGQRLKMQLGFSHDTYFDLPEGISIKIDRNILSIIGMDKQLVGAVAAKIRSLRKPEPYKGKGVRYRNEYVRSKQGKTVGGVG
ncbi:MAG: 50S ribosomal protein L6 [Candidatus Marinimicrobia bacterium]|nr:50S ribosomal protein L6 [Candidatus Neomarinimicrobiota bacterium]|tara:strand:- start:2714 stop:3256 length:543 start_codon:yes stop_codon:yes gene_type:complete